MYTNTSCTLYLSSRNYQKVTVSKCFMTSRKIATASTSGLEYQESCFCMFQGFSDLVFTEGKDYLIEGNCDLTIDDPDSEQGRSEFFKSLRNIGANTIMLADHKKYGTTGMRHWELSCK